MKIDIEYYDANILHELFSLEICPQYISAESHDPSVISKLIGCGHYNAFKLVEGKSVSQVYRDVGVITEQKRVHFRFPAHSAGPFGEDVKGDWLSPTDILLVLGFYGMGWKDIHATTMAQPCNLSYGGKIFLLCEIFLGKIRYRFHRLIEKHRA